MNTIVNLAGTQKHKKFQLAAVSGYVVREDPTTKKCSIIGMDDYIDNDFRDINEVLLMIKGDLGRKGFTIVA